MNLKKIIPAVLLILILGFAFWIRRDTFWLPHWKGDQNHYAALAMKLDKQGFSGYNLREVLTGTMILSKQPPVEFVFLKPAPPGDEGDILRTLKISGWPYYDEPLHFRAPLFPWLLMVSHRLFASDAEFYAACVSNSDENVRTFKPPIIFKMQFWLCVVPLFFNLCVVLITFFLGRSFFGDRVGLWAAFLMASNPLSLFLSYRALAEDVFTFFLALSIFLYLIFYRNKNHIGIFLSGIASGFSILAKQTAILVPLVVGLYTFLDQRKYRKGIKKIFSFEVFLFSLGAILVSGAWFWRVYKVFGSPLHTPGELSVAIVQDATGWLLELSRRPPPFIFFSFGVLYLSPVFVFSFLTIKRFYKHAAGFSADPGQGPENAETMLWIWILVFYFFNVEPWRVLELAAGQEHRFFYMTYPAIAVLAASGIERIRRAYVSKIKRPWLADAAVLALLLLNAWWGYPQAMKVVFKNSLLI